MSQRGTLAPVRPRDQVQVRPLVPAQRERSIQRSRALKNVVVKGGRQVGGGLLQVQHPMQRLHHVQAWVARRQAYLR